MTKLTKAMETGTRLKGVIFARAWWEAAVSTLSDPDRLAFYDAVFEYGFTGVTPTKLPKSLHPVFAMVRPFLDSEAQRYAERVERNRNNARSNRKASGSQSLPVADNTNTNTSTNTNTNTNTNTISIEAERERFLCLGIIFANGASDVRGEFDRFWNYYESLGWKNNKGAEIQRKTAAARMWKPKEMCSAAVIKVRRIWMECIVRSNHCSDDVFFDFRDAVAEGEKLVIFATNVSAFAALVDDSFINPLRRFAAAMGCSAVDYRG